MEEGVTEGISTWRFARPLPICLQIVGWTLRIYRTN